MNDNEVPLSTNEWQAIDIFLFSNGQLNSPPRKYHLRFEELNWWDVTLKYLANAQYGSIHSKIDLYTTDGHKLEGPLQLRHGVAYVAVEQPNMFIDSGYDKYLVKASRSMEKRQAKRPNSKETLLSAENSNLAPVEVNMATANNEVEKDNAYNVVESIAVNSSDDQDKLLELQTLLDTHMLSQKGNSATKQADKRKPSLALRPAMLRKISNFNPTDADKYHDKAVKSLEKHPAKKPNSNETFLAADATNEIAAEIIMNATNNEVQKGAVESAAVKSSKDRDKSYEPQTLHDTQRFNQKGNSSVTKQTDKRRQSLTPRPTAIQKISNIPNDTSLGSRRTSLIKSNSPPKKYHKVTGKSNEKPSLERNSGSKTVPKSINKTINNKLFETLSQPIENSIKNENVAGKLKDIIQTVNTVTPLYYAPNQKSQVTDDNQVDNLINGKDLVLLSDLYSNPINEMRSTAASAEDTAKRQSIVTQELIKINEDSEISQAIYREFATNEILDKIKQEDNSVQKNSSKIKFTTVPSIQVFSVSEKPDDSYLAIINKGDILNFQLKIEVLNADGSVNTAQKTLEPIATANLMKQDKSSQARIDNALLLQGKILCSTIASEQTQVLNSDGNSKIVMVQCGCCDHCYDNTVKHDQTEFADNKINKQSNRECHASCNCVIDLPNEEEIKKTLSKKRCTCDDDITNEKEITKTFYNKRSSILHPIKKTYSNMSLERLNFVPNKGFESISTQDINVTAVISTKFNPCEDHFRNGLEATSRHVAIGEQEVKSNQNLSENVSKTKKAECAVTQTVPRNCVDKSTQTEWCNLLLEARYHDDGRYTFHLPPLNVLKNYTI